MSISSPPSEPEPSPISRVLVVAPTPFFGDRGCHVRIYEEVRHLQQRGLEVVVATYATGQDIEGLTIRRSASLPGLRARVLGPSYGRPLLDAALSITAVRVARDLRPQIIHAHLHEGIAIGSIVRRATGARLVADLQGSFTAELIDHGFLSSHGLATGTVGRLEGWLVRRPDAVLVSSVAALPLLAEQGVPTSRVASLPDGAALEYFVPRPPDDALLDQLGLRGKRIVVFLGVLTAYQGVDALIDAVPDVVRAIPDAHFLIMGYPHEARYRAVVAERGLQPWITLPGRIPYQEAPRWLSLGVLSVSPKIAVTEANGKLLNYMSCGLPVVASDTPVNRELLGSAGVYAPPGDASALAGRIVALLEDPDRRRSLGARLRSRAESEFDWVSLTDRLLSIYRRCLDAAPGPQ